MACKHGVDFAEYTSCDQCDREDIERLEADQDRHLDTILKYRNALIDKGCDDIFCEEYKKVCRDCPCHFGNQSAIPSLYGAPVVDPEARMMNELDVLYRAYWKFIYKYHVRYPEDFKPSEMDRKDFAEELEYQGHCILVNQGY